MKIGLRIIAGFLLLCCAASFCFASPFTENGVERSYYSNKQLKAELVYKKGFLVRRRSFFKNGQLHQDYRYKKGIPYYKRDYYENGKTQCIWDKRRGIVRYYNESGRVKKIYNMKLGKYIK